MPWTPQQKLAALMRLPWTVRTRRDSEDGYIIEIDEFPSVVAAGDTEKEVGRDLWEALEATLYAYLAHGDVIPLPPGGVLPWEATEEPPQERQIARVRSTDVAWGPVPSASGDDAVRVLQLAK